MPSSGTLRALSLPIELVDRAKKEVIAETNESEVRKILMELALEFYNAGLARGSQADPCVSCGYFPPPKVPRKIPPSGG